MPDPEISIVYYEAKTSSEPFVPGDSGGVINANSNAGIWGKENFIYLGSGYYFAHGVENNTPHGLTLDGIKAAVRAEGIGNREPSIDSLRRFTSHRLDED